MDNHNYQQVKQLATSDEEHQKIFYLREFDETAENLEVPDPYSLPDAAFEKVLEMVERATDGLLVALSAASPRHT